MLRWQKGDVLEMQWRTIHWEEKVSDTADRPNKKTKSRPLNLRVCVCVCVCVFAVLGFELRALQLCTC
jgi:hypothetical protein